MTQVQNSWDIISQNFNTHIKDNEKEFKGGIKIPIYNRTAIEYDNLLTKHGFHKINEDYPPFTNEFITKYSYTKPTSVSEYMILGYKKHE